MEKFDEEQPQTPEQEEEQTPDQQEQQWQDQAEFDLVDLRICGELIERNKALDEFALAQDAEGLIAVRVQ